MNKEISIIGIPLHLGQPLDGVDLGPMAIRHASLHRTLKELGCNVEDLGDLPFYRRDLPTDTCLKLKNLTQIKEANTFLCDKVSEVISSGRFPLLLGGDHSMAIGSVAGVRKHYERLGLIWFDAHGDLNTGDTSPSGNIHGMSLAVNLGIGHPDLVNIGELSPKVRPKSTVIVGARDLDPGERTLIKDLGVHVYSMHDIDRLGIEAVMEEALSIVTHQTDGVHVSFDLDSLDSKEVMGVGTPVPGGLSYREGHLALRMLSERKVVCSAEFVEVNPLIDYKNSTAEVTVGLIRSLFGEKFVNVYHESELLEAPR